MCNAWCGITVSCCAGEADGPSGRGAVRVPGRGIPRGAGEYPGSTEGHRQRDWNDKDDATHQGPAAPPHTHPQEQVSVTPGCQ